MRNAITYHDALADGWDDRYLSGGFARRARFFERDVLPLLPAGGRWLDAGCGSGFFSRMLAREGREVLGIDASPKMVAEAESRSGNMAGQLGFTVVETVERLPFADGHFDGIICLSVLEYLQRPDDALREMARVLKPNGTVVFSAPHRRSFLRLAQAAYRRVRSKPGIGGVGYLALSRYSTVPEEVARDVERAGMTLREIFGFDPVLPPAIYAALNPSLIYVVCNKPARETA